MKGIQIQGISIKDNIFYLIFHKLIFLDAEIGKIKTIYQALADLS